MTTTTIEQFREQCAQEYWLKTSKLIAAGFDCPRSPKFNEWFFAGFDAAAAIPLPVMPEQAEPVATNPFGYIVFSDNGNVRVWWKAIDIDAAKKHCEKHQWRLEKLNIDEANTALLARVAELEARITQVKDQFAKYESSANDNDIDMMFEYEELKKLIEG